jgi:xanthine dehydrogenase molybdenum-binding subunit
MKNYSVIGQRKPKSNALELVTGKAQFAADVKLPGMLVGKILRSPHGHARIVKIDTAKAEALPGVKAVLTGQEAAKYAKPFGPHYKMDYALKPDKARYWGDEVAAVAAVDEDTAEEALRLIEVEYEVLPVVIDIEDAIKPGAPLVHEDVPSNIGYESHLRVGDIEKGFEEADLILKETFYPQTVQHVPLETWGCVVNWDPITDKLTMWKSTQSVFYDRIGLATALSLPESKVRVIMTATGGGFGNKTDGINATDLVAAILSKKTGRPVSLITERWEHLAGSRVRHAMVREIEMGFKKDGTITAHREKDYINTGAYPGMGPMVCILTPIFARGPYKTENEWIDCSMVYTNRANAGAFRGFATPQSAFAREQMLDMAAEKLGIDPYDIRMRNLVHPEDCPYMSNQRIVFNSCGVEQCLEQAAEAIGYHEKRKNKQKNRGLGLALMFHPCSIRDRPETDADFSSVYLKMNEDGTAVVYNQSSDMGSAVYTAIAQVVAEELGIEYEDVSIVTADTETTPACLGSWGSRGAMVAGNSAYRAAQQVKARLFEVAAAMLETDKDNLEAKERRIYVKGSPLKSVSIGEVATAAHFLSSVGVEAGPIMATGWWASEADLPDDNCCGNPCTTYAYAANAAEVEVDPETGKVQVLAYAAAHDVGMAINPAICETQILGGTSMAIGYGLMEGLQYEPGTGRVLNPTYLDYKILTALDMPDVKPILVEEPDTNPINHLGVRGIGETAMNCGSGTLANAVSDAVGVRVYSLPMTSEKILAAIKQKQAEA